VTLLVATTKDDSDQWIDAVRLALASEIGGRYSTHIHSKRLILRDSDDDSSLFANQTANIVSAFVSHNSIAAADLSALIVAVHKSLMTLDSSEPPEPLAPVPAVPIRKSITPDFLISLEDGKKIKSLKRALSTRYGLSPDEYRKKWGLPADYPMVAPNYSKKRSELAMGLGMGRTRGAKSTAMPGAKAKRGAR